METNEFSLPLQTVQQVKKKKPVEIHNYPKESIIQYSDFERSYTYDVIKEGNYPPIAYLKYTKGQKGFRIPDNYEVKVSLRKPKTRQIVRCMIKYVEKNPVYWIYYGDKFQYYVKSEKSSSNAACLYAKALNPEIKTRYSGPHFFGLHLEILQQTRDTHQRITVLKSFDNLTSTGRNNRAKKIAKSVSTIFDQAAANNCHLDDNPSLKSVEFNIGNSSFCISVNKENIEEIKYKARAAVQACDKGQVSREGYRTLASISQDLPREWKVSTEKREITHEMNEIIPILLVNLTPSLSDDPVNSEIHINDTEIIHNLQQSVGKGGQRNIVDILKYLIPGLIEKKILDITNPKIHLRISGDGRNVGRKVKQVMITCSILDDINNLHRPENHYTIVLYPGVEKYETLSIVLESLTVELRKLKEVGFKDNQDIEWKVELYFSSDWKFLAMCLGVNAANSKYFCPWCEVSKEQQGDFSYEWTISKTMDQIREDYTFYKGHIRPAIFDMIPLKHWVPDELHIMLRITDVLWRLVLDELRSRNTWGERARNVIIEEMKRIDVKFHFWLEVGSTNWQYTSLMGQDKLIVLQHFDLSKLFPYTRAAQIRSLWDNFYLLHKAMKNSNSDAAQFSNDARAWLHQFLDSNYFYQASDITPYMHVLVYHIPEMMRIHHNFGLAAFSCSAVEKKNHQQVSHFFKRTTKDGGTGKGRKSAIIDILEYENRLLYFKNHDEIDLIQLPKRLRVE
ncbi:hypothetical protein RhiirA1_397698 [Rhizophagus irregularis]|uniref:Uncharacterized protein n=1 Tax=Rhizophagus irregularis TaxID=588596 RepID=A0A2N0RGB2_9GLOM|nr:hypothetical protein RhiirA1_397698 [Rhizophagus irregularis]